MSAELTLVSFKDNYRCIENTIQSALGRKEKKASAARKRHTPVNAPKAPDCAGRNFYSPWNRKKHRFM